MYSAMNFLQDEYTYGTTYAGVLSHVQLFATIWTVIHQAPLSMEFSRQDYWCRLPFPPPEELPDPRIKPVSLTSSVLAGRFFATEPPGKPMLMVTITQIQI